MIPRGLKDTIVFGLCVACVALALVPLGSILVEVVLNGAPALNLDFLTHGPGIFGEAGGGVATAIEGTLILMGMSSVLGVPSGILAGVYLAEFGDVVFVGHPFLTRANSVLSGSLRFLNDVLAQFPSIVLGIMVYLIIVVATGSFSAIAGAIALSIVMLPIVTRTTEEAIKLVPNTLRDAAASLGVPKWRATVRVVLGTARNGIVTGVLLAIARVAGETAPLLLTVATSDLFFRCDSASSCAYSLAHPIDSLPVRIWTLASLPFNYARQQAWGAALLLILIILVLNVTVRLTISRRQGPIGARM